MGRPEVLSFNERSMREVSENLSAYPKEQEAADIVYLPDKGHSQSEKSHLLNVARTSFSETLLLMVDFQRIYTSVKDIILNPGDQFRETLTLILLKLKQGSNTTFDPVNSSLTTQFL